MKNSKANKAAKKTVNKTAKGAGKGDEPRSCYSKEFKENFEKIDWSKKNFVLVDQSKVYRYPDYLNELIQCLLGEEELTIEDYLVTDESMVRDFLIDSDSKDLKRIKKLEEKYSVAVLETDSFLWEIVEAMHSSRPF